MPETDWTVGHGILENGGHDTGWNARGTLGVVFLPDHNVWRVRIQWGSTWGHLVYMDDEDFDVAVDRGVREAIRQGCPPHWLPPYWPEEEC